MAHRQRSSPRLPIALLLMLASGGAGLGYQIVWTQQCALWLGHETPAVLAVVTAFFGGLAFGAFAFGPWIERHRAPSRVYAACEAVIGLWGLALVALMAPASETLLDLTGAQPGVLRQWTVSFLGTFVLLLPATAAMGATLPAMARALAARTQGRAEIAALYAANTAGALLGLLGATFWAIPVWGLQATTLLCAGLNLSCATLGGWALRGPAPPVPAAPPDDAASPAWPLAWTGLLGIAYEVLVVRVLSQVTENTVYTYALLLAVYLVGSATGAAACQRGWLAGNPAQRRERLAWRLAAACLAGTTSLWWAVDLKQALLQALGPSVGAALAAESALAIAAFGAPTFVMGALFSHLCSQAQSGIGFGRCLGWNTLGAALAPLLAGVAAAPALGPKMALVGVSTGYLLLSRHRRAPMLATLFAAVALGIAAPPLAFVDLPEGGRLLDYREGARGTVSVVQDGRGVASLHIDNREQEGSSATGWADGRQAVLPLLLHPAPHRALLLGLGTGLTAAAAAHDPQLQADVVELVPEVIAVHAHFVDPWPDRLHVTVGDARRFVRTSTAQYDLIVADNFHPARSGSGALYTVEHFRAVGARLAPGGLYCQWLPLHQLDLETLRSIVRAFLLAYPDATAVLATNSLATPVVGLLGRKGMAQLDAGQLRQRLADAASWQHPPAAYGFEDQWAVLGSFIAGPRSLQHFVESAAVNTDDRPVVAYQAPRVAYAPGSSPSDRLETLLHTVSIQPDELLARPEADTRRRLAAYWTARQRFIAAGRTVAPSADAARMLAQVQEPLLEVLRLSADFRPAYDPLLRLAEAAQVVDPARARTLLEQLASLQPARPEAARLLTATPR